MRLKKDWDRWILNPNKTSLSEIVFEDLISKIKDNFFNNSRKYNFTDKNTLIKQAYGKI